jgi:hypothetical protein
VKKRSLAFLSILSIFKEASAQNTNSVKVVTNVKSEKHLSSSILLWMRTDKPRQAGMDRWKGPHAQIIAANKGLLEYRQTFCIIIQGTAITNGVETKITPIVKLMV